MIGRGALADAGDMVPTTAATWAAAGGGGGGAAAAGGGVVVGAITEVVKVEPLSRSLH